MSIVVGTFVVNESVPCTKEPPVKLPCVKEPEPAAVTPVTVLAVSLIGTVTFSKTQLDADPVLVTFGIVTVVVVILLAVVVVACTPVTEVVDD